MGGCWRGLGIDGASPSLGSRSSGPPCPSDLAIACSCALNRPLRRGRHHTHAKHGNYKSWFDRPEAPQPSGAPSSQQLSGPVEAALLARSGREAGGRAWGGAIWDAMRLSKFSTKVEIGFLTPFILLTPTFGVPNRGRPCEINKFHRPRGFIGACSGRQECEAAEEDARAFHFEGTEHGTDLRNNQSPFPTRQRSCQSGQRYFRLPPRVVVQQQQQLQLVERASSAAEPDLIGGRWTPSHLGRPHLTDRSTAWHTHHRHER